jgi:GntR family transcriptional regulator of arabinose operon
VYTYVIDQARIGRLAIEHLARRGHRRVLAMMPDDDVLRGLAEERLSGAREAAGEHDVALRSVEVRVRREAINQVLTGELDRTGRATAIYAFNDELALIVLELLREREIPLPDQMALIGCDDSPAAQQIRPRLTTLRFDAHGRWREIAGHLHAMISGEGRAPKLTVSEPAVVLGDTT